MACQAEIDELREYGEVRHPHPDGGTCGECSHCYKDCFDECGSRSVRDELAARYGICLYDECQPVLVPLGRWVSWEDCWSGGAS